ncbi:hypothetical protein QJQ45_012851 [Haematococcus lacustris]|nr:hypothetical protein QJQ45_012851 [Haematococcus lacustris]
MHDIQREEIQRKEQHVVEQQHQLQQQQADLHLREKQVAEQQHELQQQQADMHLREQQVAEQHKLQQQQHADMHLREQQQKADMHLREQQVTEQHQLQQQQQADMHLREKQVAEQHQLQQLQHQLNRLQQQLEARRGAELQRQVQQQLAAQQHLLQQQQADLLLKQQQVEKQLQEAADQQAVSANHPLPDHPTCSPLVPGSLRSPLFKRPRQDTTLTPMPSLPASNRFAMLPEADEQEQQFPSQPANAGAMRKARGNPTPAIPSTIRPVWDLRLHRQQQQQQQQPQPLSTSPQAWQLRLQPLLNEFQLHQHRRMQSVVSLATCVVPPTPDQVLGAIMVESLRPVLAGIKPVPGGQRSTNQQPFNTALIMTMGRGIEQHGIKRTARKLGITPHAVKRARRSHLSNLAAGAAADWAAAPLRRGRRCLSQEQLEYVRTFFEEHSSPSPMYKDVRRYYVRMTAGSSKRSEVRMSRRYVDRSLKKLYLEYERECPANLKVGSTAFEMLRPPWVKRITAAHKQVCVCIPCETCELQLDQLGKHMDSLELPEDSQPLDDSDSDCGSDSGGGDGELHVLLAEHIANADAQDLAGVLDAACDACKDRKVGVKAGCEGVQLQYRQFNKLHNGRGVELATVQTTLGGLVAGLNDLMQKQLWHQYLAKHQRATFRAHCATVKNTPGLVVVSCDWSEKLTIHQDIACQGAYWKQRTMSVFVACAHYQDMAGNYREESVFVKRHPDGILGVASNPDGVGDGRDDGEGWVGKIDMRQLCLWSDGCASQFKGAKAIRLHWHLANRFGVPVQWSYGATSHFKSTHDSEGGVIKREWREQMLVHLELVGKVCGAAVLTDWANKHFAVPCHAQDTSASHRLRGHIMFRRYLVLDLARQAAVCSMPEADVKRMHDDVVGCRAMHRMVFTPDREQAQWAMAACACSTCMRVPCLPCMKTDSTTPLKRMPMFQDTVKEVREDEECYALLMLFHSDLLHDEPQFRYSDGIHPQVSKINNTAGVVSAVANSQAVEQAANDAKEASSAAVAAAVSSATATAKATATAIAKASVQVSVQGTGIACADASANANAIGETHTHTWSCTTWDPAQPSPPQALLPALAPSPQHLVARGQLTRVELIAAWC